MKKTYKVVCKFCYGSKKIFNPFTEKYNDCPCKKGYTLEKY